MNGYFEIATQMRPASDFMNASINKIRNGDVAKSPLFVLTVTGGMVALATSVIGVAIWAGKLDERVRGIDKTIEGHRALSAHSDAKANLKVIDSRLDNMDQRLERIERNVERMNGAVSP